MINFGKRVSGHSPTEKMPPAQNCTPGPLCFRQSGQNPAHNIFKVGNTHEYFPFFLYFIYLFERSITSCANWKYTSNNQSDLCSKVQWILMEFDKSMNIHLYLQS